MLKETTNINKSLFVLGKVISALADRDTAGTSAHIPYRCARGRVCARACVCASATIPARARVCMCSCVRVCVCVGGGSAPR